MLTKAVGGNATRKLVRIRRRRDGFVGQIHGLHGNARQGDPAGIGYQLSSPRLTLCDAVVSSSLHPAISRASTVTAVHSYS
jgi:hypothetical protein